MCSMKKKKKKKKQQQKNQPLSSQLELHKHFPFFLPPSSLFFFFFLAYHSMQKFLVQGLNLSCSSNCSSNQSTDNAESLTTRLPENSIQGLFFEKAIGLWLLCSKGTKRYYLFGHTEY